MNKKEKMMLCVEYAKFVGVNTPEEMLKEVNYFISLKKQPIIKKLAAIAVAIEGGYVEEYNHHGIYWQFYLPKTKDCVTIDAIRRARKVLRRKGYEKLRLKDLSFQPYKEEETAV